MKVFRQFMALISSWTLLTAPVYGSTVDIGIDTTDLSIGYQEQSYTPTPLMLKGLDDNPPSVFNSGYSYDSYDFGSPYTYEYDFSLDLGRDYDSDPLAGFGLKPWLPEANWYSPLKPSIFDDDYFSFTLNDFIVSKPLFCEGNREINPIAGNKELGLIIGETSKYLCGTDGSSYETHPENYCRCVVEKVESGEGWYSDVIKKADENGADSKKLMNSIKETLVKHKLQKFHTSYRNSTAKMIAASIDPTFSDELSNEHQMANNKIKCVPGGMTNFMDMTYQGNGQGQSLCKAKDLDDTFASIIEGDEEKKAKVMQMLRDMGVRDEDLMLSANWMSSYERRLSGLGQDMHGPGQSGSSRFARKFDIASNAIFINYLKALNIEVPDQANGENFGRLSFDEKIKFLESDIAKFYESPEREKYRKEVNLAVQELAKLAKTDNVELTESQKENIEKKRSLVLKFLNTEALYKGYVAQPDGKSDSDLTTEEKIAPFIDSVNDKIASASEGNLSKFSGLDLIDEIIVGIGVKEKGEALNSCSKTHEEFAQLCHIISSNPEDFSLSNIVDGETKDPEFLKMVLEELKEVYGTDEVEGIKEQVQVVLCVEENRAQIMADNQKPNGGDGAPGMTMMGEGSNSHIQDYYNMQGVDFSTITDEDLNQISFQSSRRSRRSGGSGDISISSSELDYSPGGSVSSSIQSYDNTDEPLVDQVDQKSKVNPVVAANPNRYLSNSTLNNKSVLPNMNPDGSINPFDPAKEQQVKADFPSESKAISQLQSRIDALVARIEKSEEDSKAKSGEDDSDNVQDEDDPELAEIKRQLEEAQKELATQRLSLQKKVDQKKKKETSVASVPTISGPFGQGVVRTNNNTVRSTDQSPIVDNSSQVSATGQQFVGSSTGSVRSFESDGQSFSTQGQSLSGKVSDSAFTLSEGSYFLIQQDGAFNIDDINLSEAVKAAQGKRIIVPDENSSTGYVELVVEEGEDGLTVSNVLEVIVDDSKPSRAIASEGVPEVIEETSEDFVGPVRNRLEWADAEKLIQDNVPTEP